MEGEFQTGEYKRAPLRHAVSYGHEAPAQLHSSVSCVLLKHVAALSTVVGPNSAQNPATSHIKQYIKP